MNSEKKYADLIRLVQEKNATLNGGHGTRILDAVLVYLDRDDLEAAQGKCEFDHDKLRQYDIDGWLRDVGLFSESYVARLNRWGDWRW